MSDDNLRQLRVLHLVSSGGVTGPMQQALFIPLLTRMPKQRVKAQIVSLAPGFMPAAVLRQSGIPVHEVALSRKRFSMSALRELVEASRQFHPDVIHAWGHTAQIAAMYVRARCDWAPKVIWSPVETAPLPKNAGFIDKRKLRMAARRSSKVDRIVYTSEAAASAHRRCGYPESDTAVIAPGVDPTRFKPDAALRLKIREQLGLEPDAFVIGMIAPFQPEYDHATLIKGVGELIKTQPNVSVLLAGHGVQKGNAPLMALVGGGSLSTRVQLLGEWTDIASFYAACDVACSSALIDGTRMNLVTAMLCGVPCVATGMGAQGEVVGQFGVAIEPASPPAFIRGITRIMQMPPERRAHMVQGARKHALTNFVWVRSLQKYLQLYFDVVGRQALAVQDVPTPEIDAAIPASKPVGLPASPAKAKTAARDSVSMHELSDPDSLEARVSSSKSEPQKAKSSGDGDVLQIFESNQKRVSSSTATPMSERARGIAEDLGDLLAPEVLQTGKVSSQRASAPAAAPVAVATPAVTASMAVVAPAITAPVIEAKKAPAAATPRVRGTPIQLPMLDPEIMDHLLQDEPTLQLELLPASEERRRAS